MRELVAGCGCPYTNNSRHSLITICSSSRSVPVIRYVQADAVSGVETQLAYISQPSHGFRERLSDIRSWNWRLLFVLAVNAIGWIMIGKLALHVF